MCDSLTSVGVQTTTCLIDENKTVSKMKLEGRDPQTSHFGFWNQPMNHKKYHDFSLLLSRKRL